MRTALAIADSMPMFMGARPHLDRPLPMRTHEQEQRANRRGRATRTSHGRCDCLLFRFLDRLPNIDSVSIRISENECAQTELPE
jgi:hypothetical protein